MIETVTVRDSYKYYKDNTTDPIPPKEYYRIISGFLKFIMKKVFEGHNVQLSNGQSLGAIGIRGTKMKPRLNDEGQIRGLAPDWGSTRKLWNENPEAKATKKIVYHFNEHTNGISYRLVWWRKKMKIANKFIYSLVFTKGPKGNKRHLSKLLKEGKEYLVTLEK